MNSDRFIVALFAVLALISIAVTALGSLDISIGAFFVFVLALATLIFKDRRNVKLEGIVFIRRTQKGRDFIDRSAQSHRSFWRRWAVLGLIVAIPVMVIGSVYLVSQAASVVAGSAEGGVRLLLPGPVSSPVNAPGIFVVPWWIWVIGIACVIIPHEFMHGIVCRLDKIKIKSVGWILLVVIPGAFVEPDEKQLQKSKRSTRMKVYAAGSFANLVTAGIMLLIMVLATATSFHASGIFGEVNETGPAHAAGLNSSIAIISIDSQQIASQADLVSVLSAHKAGDTVTVRAANITGVMHSFLGIAPILNQSSARDYSVTLSQNPDIAGRAYIGIAVNDPAFRSYTFDGDITSFLGFMQIVSWIFIFSFGIGLLNLLPLKPLDGGLLFEDIVGKFTKRTRNIVRAMGVVIICLILFNLLGPIFL